MRRRTVAAGCIAALVVVLAAAGWTRVRDDGPHAPWMAARPQVLFDDFAHTGRRQLEARGWRVRTERGWPGVRGAAWAGISLVANPQRSGDRLLRLTASTDGTPDGTTQAQLCHARKYREGTFAARVRFRDRPSNGARGDHVVETFYLISPLRAPLDPSYSELDFEYLPGGGWGVGEPTLYANTWETFSPEPNWIADNTSGRVTGSHDGWHTLVLQISDGKAAYYVDGRRFAEHRGRFYPEVPMSINFNLWFLADGLRAPGGPRRYEEDVDWVFHQAGAVLSPRAVAASVASLRRVGIAFQDTVPAARPALRAPCNL